MTTFEQRLATMDLTPFKTEEFKTQPMELLLKQIYKYQKFKTKSILQKINRLSFTTGTVTGYVSIAKKYLNTGIKVEKVVSPRFYQILDDLKAKHEAILTPSDKDRATVYKQRKPRKQTPSPTPTRVVEPPKYTEIIPDQYGVKIQNVIKLFANKEACDAYMECFKEFNKELPVELVKVEFEVV